LATHTELLAFLKNWRNVRQFPVCGTSPLIRDLLNNSATVYEISAADSINIHVPAKSTPGALFIFSLSSLALTMLGLT